MMGKLLLALLTGGALLVAACGDDETTTADGARGNPTDRAFVKEMIPHHESAIDMAKIAQRRGESQFVKTLADNIVRTQADEIRALRREDEALATAGVEVGSLDMSHEMMGMDMDAGTLEQADPVGRAFLEMMIPHHEGSVEMAKVELGKGEDPELREIAQEIIDAQEREIREMREQLDRTS